jgi:dTMP kinase
MKKGKFIVIEGVDGSGKTTQFNLLHGRLREKHKEILVADFPRYYDSIWGKVVGEFLTGKFGKLENVPPQLSVLLFMLDQYIWSRDIGKSWLKKKGLIISNRYFTSNVHQIARLNGIARRKFREWLWPAGYESLGILKPDLVIFLDVKPNISFKLSRLKTERGYLKGRKRDLAEINKNHQIQAYKEYLLTVRNNQNWVKVKCVTKGVLDLPEIIHERVWERVNRIIA